MSKPPLSNVGPGDLIPLDMTTINAWNGAGREYLRGRGGFSAPAIPGGPTVPQVLVLVQNSTGGDLAEWSVVALTGTPPVSRVDSPHEVRQMPVLDGSTPAAATDAFAVLIEPIQNGKVGRAAVLGVVPVSVHVNDAGHGYATPGTTTDALESAASGPAKIIWKESSGTTRKALVLLMGDMGGGGSLSGYRYGLNTPFATGSLTAASQVMTVPRGNYLVTACVSPHFSGGAASVFFGINMCNEGDTPVSPKLPISPVRVDGASGAYLSVTLHQLIAAGELDDDGSTPNVDIKVYRGTYSGTPPIFDTTQLTAIPVAAVIDA